MKKFRPCLTAQQIHYLHLLVKADSHLGHESLKRELEAYFKVFITKMEVGSVSEAFAITPKQSLEEKLGLTNLEASRHSAYLKYQSNPALCTEREIQMARTHMYEEGIMTAEEERAFENE